MRGAIRSELENADMVYRFREVKTVFQQEGWMDYFDIMKGGDVVISMEIMRTYENAVVDVQGLKV